MTQSDWENELAALRSDLGPTRPMLMTWVASYETGGLWRRASLGRWEIVLYPADARVGDLPVAFTYLPADAPLPLAQPVVVEVAGRTEPGGALAFRLPAGNVLYGSYPARQPGWLHRWRLTEPVRREHHEQLRRAWASCRALPRGVISLVVALVALAQQAWLAAAMCAALGVGLVGHAWRRAEQLRQRATNERRA